MYRFTGWLGVAVVLQACIITRQTWPTHRDRAVCDVLVGCFEAYASEADCLDAMRESPEACEGYRWLVANDCISALKATAKDCPEDAEDWHLPGACVEVCSKTELPTME